MTVRAQPIYVGLKAGSDIGLTMEKCYRCKFHVGSKTDAKIQIIAAKRVRRPTGRTTSMAFYKPGAPSVIDTLVNPERSSCSLGTVYCWLHVIPIS